MLSAAILFVMSGCLNHGGEDSDAESGGGAGGGTSQASWQPISKADSQISLADYDKPVVTRRAKNQQLGTRKIYSETIGLEHGRISYNRIQYEEDFPIGSAEELLGKIVEKNEDLQKINLTVNTGEIEPAIIESGPLASVYAKNSALQCLFFYLHSDSSDVGEKKGMLESANGHYCDSVETGFEDFERAANDQIAAIRFDRGNYERDQSFSNLFGQLDQLENRDNLLDDEERDAADVRPRVVVTSRVETMEPVVRLAGYVGSSEELQRIDMDGQPIELDENGHFKVDIPMDVGDRSVTFEAEDVKGGIGARTVRITRYPESSNFLPRERLGEYHALIIGINDYPDWLGQYVSDTGDADLANAISDAEQLAAVLEQDYGYKVRFLRDATVKQITDSLIFYRDNLTAEDNLLIFYAGHGIVVGEIGYWMPSDVQRGQESTLISNRLLSRTLSQFDVGKVMLIADACYSASFVNQTRRVETGDFDRFNNQNSIVRAAMSSGGLEVVSDGIGQSPFNEALVTGLKRNDGVVSAQQLFVVVKSLTVRKAQQTPQYGAVPASGHQEGGDFLFVKKTPFRSAPTGQVSG